MNLTEGYLKPCPFCGGKNLKFTYNSHSGHGDSGFTNARIKCNDCSGSKGDGSGYGTPTGKDKSKAWKEWNERK